MAFPCSHSLSFFLLPACRRNLNKFSPLKRHEILSLSLGSLSLFLWPHTKINLGTQQGRIKKRGKKPQLAVSVCCINQHTANKKQIICLLFGRRKNYIYLSRPLLASLIGETLSGNDARFLSPLAKTKHGFLHCN